MRKPEILKKLCFWKLAMNAVSFCSIKVFKKLSKPLVISQNLLEFLKGFKKCLYFISPVELR